MKNTLEPWSLVYILDQYVIFTQLTDYKMHGYGVYRYALGSRYSLLVHVDVFEQGLCSDRWNTVHLQTVSRVDRSQR